MRKKFPNFNYFRKEKYFDLPQQNFLSGLALKSTRIFLLLRESVSDIKSGFFLVFSATSMSLFKPVKQLVNVGRSAKDKRLLSVCRR